MIPSIYSVSPAEGLTSGRNVVTVTGSSFRLYEPPASGPAPAASIGWVQTVLVEVDGRPADKVAALGEGQLLAVVPEYHGDPDALPAVVDVRVQNLDDSGDAIVGEEHTLSGGYTYKRPSLVVMNSVAWVVRQFILTLRRNVIQNVSMSPSPDYSQHPALRMTFASGLPAVVLSLPTCAENRFYRNVRPRIEDGPGGKTKKTAPFTGDLTFDMMVVGRNKAEAFALKNAALRYFHRRPRFTFPAGPSDTTDVTVRCIVQGEWRPRGNKAHRTFLYENTIRLEGLTFDDAYGQAAAGVPVDDFFTAVTDDDPGYLDVAAEEQDGQ